VGFASRSEKPVDLFNGNGPRLGAAVLRQDPHPDGRGITKLNQASRGRRPKAWTDKKLSEVSGEIAGRYKMKTGGIQDTEQASPTSTRRTWTDLDFLREMPSGSAKRWAAT